MISSIHPSPFTSAMSAPIESFFFGTMAAPGERHPKLFGGGIHEVAYRILLTRRNNVVIRRILLKHEPLHFDVVARVAPVAFRV